MYEFFNVNKVVLTLSALVDFYVKLINSNFSFNLKYEGWNFNSGNYLFTTDTK